MEIKRTPLYLGDSTHTHRCVVCDAEIRCESPDDPQGCLVNALSCGDCDEPFQGKDGVGDVEAQEFPDLSQGNDEEDWIDDFLMEEDEADYAAQPEIIPDLLTP